ncbi:hypothetical protein COCCADRAFT_41791 [Bipolaris zeicola 26-R-13]|uniref:Cytochrome P450 monooxygenase n=1 Tax=Cochliobolus carbonum (strain 26-R-13) TaxID=930089 RepID=W6XXN1_COCC2|nr:uncharacterized protein COCCADRAFT_41791 [Bipolaris zeicola 26-R-13]EUC27499.1 hypothetical protein COCCADRAFT_41791 [Bipolaris zeicola 26-R-13]
MGGKTLTQLTYVLQAVIIATVILTVCIYVPSFKRKIRLRSLPVLSSLSGERQRRAYLKSARRMYQYGYAKFKNSVYRITQEEGVENVVVPASLLPELRNLQDDVLSFPIAFKTLNETKYTKLNLELPAGIHAIKTNLTQSLTRLSPIISSEVDAAMRQYMPSCENWSEVNINKILLYVVSQVSGRIFVGPELCRNPEYIELVTNYTVYLGATVAAVKQLRPWLKPFLAHRLPEVVQLRKYQQRLSEFVLPIINERMTAKAKDPNWQEPDDMLQWIIARSSGKEGDGKASIEDIASFQITLIFGAIHTTTLTATNILYTLAVTPEYICPIREEMRNVIAENGGIVTSRALQQMGKLDSYMREVNRFYAPGITAFSRRALKGITLSNGQYIPPGVTIEVPSAAIHLDDEYFPSGDVFDGFRSYKLCASGKEAVIARNQFVTSNETNLAFGYGRHVCPGRFFAANEIKMILVKLILEYDVKMPNGETERYAQIDVGPASIPDTEKTLAFKKVEI